MTNQLLLFLGVIVGAILLSLGLGVTLAAVMYFLDRLLHRPAGQATPAPDKATGQPPLSQRLAGPLGIGFAIVVLAAGVLVGLYVQLMPIEASSESRLVDVLFSTLLGIAASIFLLVEGVLLYSAIRFRRRKGETGDGLPIHGSNRLELA